MELPYTCKKFMSLAPSHTKLNVKSFPHVKCSHKCLRELVEFRSSLDFFFINKAGGNEKMITIF